MALGASLLCPAARIIATEGDEQAVPSFASNLGLNPQCRVQCVLTRGVPVSPGWAEMAVVNMTYAEHLEVRDQLVSALQGTSRVVLSGLFHHQAPELGKWWMDRGFHPLDRREKGEWTALLLGRSAGH